MRQLKLSILSALVTIACAAAAHADEGMWTFHNPPTQLITQKYGVNVLHASARSG